MRLALSCCTEQHGVWISDSAWVTSSNCHGVAQVASVRLPTAAAQVRAQLRSCSICGERRGTETVLPVLLFLMASIPI
jgi:hypothetical protein